MTTSNDRARLWIGGQSTIECIDAQTYEQLWRWDAAVAEDLTVEQRAWFESIDEVKPAVWAGERVVLITASSQGGAALVRRSDRRVLWAERAPDAHTMEITATGALAIACSDPFDRLILRDGQERAELTFPNAHGLVWDRAAGLLWAGGGDQLLLVDCAGGRLRVVERFALPEDNAHDLVVDPRTGHLIWSSARGVWAFDPSSREFAPFAPLARVPKVKSINIDAASGRVAFIKGEGGNWWSDTVYILSPEGTLSVYLRPKAKLYKVRWDQPQQR